jgi:hypothetical protein
MRIDLHDVGSWWRTCDVYREAVAQAYPALKDPALNIQVYPGLPFALKEIGLSLSELLLTKKTIVLVSDGEPEFENLAVFFSERGFQTLILTLAEFNKPGEWYTPIASDVLFVMYSKDHPITGEMYDLTAGLEGLKAARTHRIAISHFTHRFIPLLRPLPFELNLLSISSEVAVMVAGERGRIKPLLVDQLSWAMPDRTEIQKGLTQTDDETKSLRREAIENFEAALPAGFRAWFAPGAKRALDRAVFFHEHFDGSAVIELLSQKMAIGLAKPGLAGLLETTSQCRWNQPRLGEWLEQQGMKPNVSRGLIMVDQSLISGELVQHLEAVTTELKRFQNGS